jgi:hypothetical protein
MPDGRSADCNDETGPEYRNRDSRSALPAADAERLHRRAVLLREIASARARAARAAPWRTGTARLRIGRLRRGLR